MSQVQIMAIVMLMLAVANILTITVVRSLHKRIMKLEERQFGRGKQ